MSHRFRHLTNAPLKSLGSLYAAERIKQITASATDYRQAQTPMLSTDYRRSDREIIS